MIEKLAIFKNLCPNCGGEIDNVQLEEGLACNLCSVKKAEKICDSIEEKKLMKNLCLADEKVQRFSEFFKLIIGSEPWNLQLTWAKRFFLDKSFAIQAPTGIGKTTFGLVMSLYIDGKSYLIFPTRLLAKQSYDKLKQFKKSVKLKKKIVFYSGKKSEKEEIVNGNFDILITTNMFLHKNISELENIKFDFIFVDDVDSMLKTPKNIDNIFRLLKLNENDIKDAINNQNIEDIKKKIEGKIIVSSATLKPRTKRINLFRNLLGFEVQQSTVTIRDIRDFYVDCNSWEDAKEKLVEIVRILGNGCLAFVPIDKGREGVEEIVDYLNKKGIPSVSYEDFQDKLNEFKKGKIKVAVGISISSNSLVRGIDLPREIRYTVFVDVPKYIFQLTPDYNIQKLITILRILAQIEENQKHREKMLGYLSYLKNYSSLRGEELNKYPKIKERITEIIEYLNLKLSEPTLIEKLKNDERISLFKKDDSLYIVIGDSGSYIQASGRCSRILLGGFTKGISITLAVDKKALTSLMERVRYYLPTETKIERLDDINELKKFINELDESRNITKIIQKPREDIIKTVLTIVESPNKARTISTFFGRPQRRWTNGLTAYEVSLGNLYLIVVASIGHVFDLVTDEGIFGITEENQHYIPIYSSIKKCKICGEQTADRVCHKCKSTELVDKIEIIKALRELAYESNEIYIATDPDSEGEKIAWDLFVSLKPINSNIKRIEFHEVTPVAFKRAIEESRAIDKQRVKAQIVRRIADRWVGFVFSKKVQHELDKFYLSAGRVQTPVLGWVVEREKEVRYKKARIILTLNESIPFIIDIEDLEKAKEIYENIEKAELSIGNPYTEEITPPPPYTTSELLKDTADKLNLSSEETMKLAQELFESGYITYHRTDSTRVSSFGISIAKEYIEKHFHGMFKGRTWEEGGAHECIRPTKIIPPEELEILVNTGEAELDKKSIKVYSLIFKRFIASMMKKAVVKKVPITLNLKDFSHTEIIVSEIVEDGFNLVFPIKTYPITDMLKITGKKYQEIPKTWRFTEGGLIDEMKKRGLGRPSTYAKIIQILFERKYIVKNKNSLIPTKNGIQVFEYLKKFYPYTSEEFTRILEQKMDLIEHGKEDYQEVLKEISNVLNFL